MKPSPEDAPEFRVVTAVADTLFPCLEADAAEAAEHGLDKIAVFMRTSGASPTVTKEVRALRSLPALMLARGAALASLWQAAGEALASACKPCTSV